MKVDHTKPRGFNLPGRDRQVEGWRPEFSDPILAATTLSSRERPMHRAKDCIWFQNTFNATSVYTIQSCGLHPGPSLIWVPLLQQNLDVGRSSREAHDTIERADNHGLPHISIRRVPLMNHRRDARCNLSLGTSCPASRALGCSFE